MSAVFSGIYLRSFYVFFSRLLSFQGHTDENRYTSFSSLYLGLTEEILNEEHLARLQLYKAKCFHWQIKKQAEMKLTKGEAKRSGKGFNSENTAVHRNVSKGENRTTSRSWTLKKIITVLEKKKSDLYRFETLTSATSVQRCNRL